METTPALRKNHRALRRLLICIGAAAILIGALFTWLGANMRSAMTALATARIRSVAAKAMNDAILDTMQQDENYTELLHIRENGSKVYMVQADPRQMNLLSAQCAEAAQQRIAAPWRARHSHTAWHDNGNFVPFRQGAGPFMFHTRPPAACRASFHRNSPPPA